jgi:hypothetical protein
MDDSWIITIIGGIISSVIGGLIVAAIRGRNPNPPNFNAGHILMLVARLTVFGACMALLAYVFVDLMAFHYIEGSLRTTLNVVKVFLWLAAAIGIFRVIVLGDKRPFH